MQDSWKFESWWENEYFFIELKEKSVWFETVAVMKEYDVRWHYETKHQTYKFYTGAKWAGQFIINQLVS